MKFSKLLAGLLAGLAISGSVQAEIVDHGNYLTDTATGLDWLDVTQTVNMSYNQVSSQFGAGGAYAGWTYANGIQFIELVSNFTSMSVTSLPTFTMLPNKTDGLVALLGSTLDTLWLHYYGVTFDEFDHGSISYHYTQGILADVRHSSAQHYVPGPTHYTAVLEDFDVNGIPVFDHVEVFNFYVLDANSDYSTGSFLVRASATQINEPESIALLSVGLLGLLASRRKSKKA